MIRNFQIDLGSKTIVFSYNSAWFYQTLVPSLSGSDEKSYRDVFLGVFRRVEKTHGTIWTMIFFCFMVNIGSPLPSQED